MIPATPRHRLSIGDLCIVSALGRNGALADSKVPVSYHLQVIVADAADPMLKGHRFMMRPLNRYIRDHERHWSELIPLAAFGMRIAEVWRNWNDIACIRVERDPSIEPQTDPDTHEPYAWGNTLGGRIPAMDALERQTSVGEDAVPFIRLPDGMAFLARAA